MFESHSPEQTVQLIALISLTVLGASHIFQPKMWVEYFGSLADQGTNGLITSVVGLQFMPAVVLVSLHQVWTGPAVVLTVYGWLLLAKCTLALLFPARGSRGLRMARHHGQRGFVVAGVMLLFVAGACGLALYGQGIRG